MRIVIFTTKEHIYANIIIKELLLDPNLKILAVVESEILHPGKNRMQALIHILKESGFYFLFFKVIKSLYFGIARNIYTLLPFKNEKNILFPFARIAHKNNIPVISTEEINSKSIVKTLAENKPDLFISVFLNQLFKLELISLPKHGIINVHPSLLPSYRGMYPIFWVLANNEKTTGVTIHEIPSESIDTGRIIVQKEVPILKHDSEYSLYLRCVLQTIPLLKKTILALEQKKKICKKIKVHAKKSYFSLPTKKAVKKFRGNGRKFFRFTDLFVNTKKNDGCYW